MHEEQDTGSPQASPMVEAICAQQGTCSKEHRAQGQRLPSRSVGKTWLALGLGPLGIPFGPTFAGRTGNRIYFGESIRKKVRVEGRLPLDKEVVGARSTTGEGFSLRS